PMSSEQRRLYILSQLENGEMPYHLLVAFFIEGKPDIDRMNEAFKQLIQRHDMLRTCFDSVDDESGNTSLIQRIHEQSEFNIDFKLGHENDVAQLAQQFIQPFDLTFPPLMRVCLIQLKPSLHLFLFDIHHLIADGISLSIMMREFLQGYQGKTLPIVSSQYRDYVEWQSAFLSSEKIKKHEPFWLNNHHLRNELDEIPVLNLATDYPRPARQQFEGDHVWFSLDEQATASLIALAQHTETSLFMITLAAYFVLLSKLSGQEDMIVGIPVAGRSQKRFETTIGMFVNTLPIRQQPIGTIQFLEFLHQVKKHLLSVYDYQDYPFELIVQHLNIPRNVSRNPLFDVMFNFENDDERLFTIDGLRFSSYDIKPNASMIDLTLEVIQSSEKLNMRFEYSTKLFKRETVERWSVYYRNILNKITLDPNICLADMDMLPEWEKYRILEEFNNTHAEYPISETLVSLFEKQVEKTPDTLALIFRDIQLTYSELNKRANQAAHILKHNFGIQEDDPVGIMVERSEFMVIGIYSILKAGGAYMPIHPEYPDERIRYMIEDSKCKLVLTEKKWLYRVSSIEYSSLDIGSIQEGNTTNPNSGVLPSNLAYIIYTSGSTGQPKGVMIEHTSVINRIHWMNTQYPIKEGDIILQKTPFTFDVSVWELFWWSFYGLPLCLLEPGGEKEPETIINTIYENKITVIHFVPPMLSAFLEYLENSKESYKISCLKHVFVSGEVLTAAQVNTFNVLLGKPYHIQLHNLYGPTEATVDVTYFDCPQDFHLSVVPIGKPVDNTQIFILDKTMKHPVPIGVIGEICIGGVLLSRGYVNKPKLTAEKFIPHPFNTGERIYRTGDLGKWWSDGNIEYIGRTDHQVKIRGHRIELGEIENALLTYPSIREAVVLAKETQIGKELAAYFVSSEEISSSDVKAHLKTYLPDYMIPSYLIPMKQFSLNPNGKIDRKALPNPLESSLTLKLGTEYTPARNAIEQTMVSIWESVLDRRNMGIDDDFFALGGDSIKALQLISRINTSLITKAQFRKKLQVRDIFQYPRMNDLLSAIHNLSQQPLPIHELSSIQGNIPLTAIQTWLFKQHNQHKNQFVQAVLLELSPIHQSHLQESALRTALEAVQLHHDALRIQYRFDGNTIIQGYMDVKCPVDFRTVHIKESHHITEVIDRYGSELAESFSLVQGPLMKSILFKTEDTDFLLMMIHHLIIDGVSWRILMEDIETAYQQAIANTPIHLPEKTDSFKRWSEKIHEFANSEIILKEKAFWQSLESTNIKPIRRDYPFCDDDTVLTQEEVNEIINSDETHFYKDNMVISAALTKNDTDVLMTRVNQAYHTEINDILLTALARALNQWHGQRSHSIMLEGHGREPLFEDSDMSRTIGWFTALYPIVLELPQSEEVGDQVKWIKESLRSVPNKGIGYGMLKYLTDDGHKQDLIFNKSPQILFNYLGQFDQQNNRGVFKTVKEFTQNTVHPNFIKEHDFEIEGMVLDGNLNFSISYSPNQYKKERVEHLLKLYIQEIKSVISHCSHKETPELTPSDLTYKQLSSETLDNLIRNAGIQHHNLKDIYPLSPTQEGLLFHHLYQKESQAYFEQFSLSISGTFSIELFKKSWNEIGHRYDILRTVFSHKYTERPVQLVLKDRPVEFYTEDISLLNTEEQLAHIRNFKQSDREKGFDLCQDILMRFSIFYTGDNHYEVIWSHHHILMDGWCFGILNKELFEIYQALKNGIKPNLAAVIPYSRYIMWLEHKDKTAAKHFWAAYLDGYDFPVSLYSHG
ncbi:MAG: amino acid adenylation domain-containing protein, partial [Desulfobacterales bacterium]|nr:amino acid adenylation domain-containing protein [Desulfobacterales bacterium]